MLRAALRLPIIIGILACGILIVPEFYSVLSNRMDSPINISLFDLLVPKFNLSYLMYNSYGVGLTSIVLFGLTTGASLCFPKREPA